MEVELINNATERLYTSINDWSSEFQDGTQTMYESYPANYLGENIFIESHKDTHGDYIAVFVGDECRGIAEFREDYQWGRAIIKSGKYGLSALAGFERTEDETQALYGLVWQYGEPNRFLSAELSGEGDVMVKLYYGFNLNIGKENE